MRPEAASASGSKQIEQSGSPSNLWYAARFGPVHLITLCSYADYAPGSIQYAWLEDEFSRVNRSATPWLIVQMHAPWYNSNSGHYGEAVLMLSDMEDILYEAGVDLVISGHVHVSRVCLLASWGAA